MKNKLLAIGLALLMVFSLALVSCEEDTKEEANLSEAPDLIEAGEPPAGLAEGGEASIELAEVEEAPADLAEAGEAPDSLAEPEALAIESATEGENALGFSDTPVTTIDPSAAEDTSGTSDTTVTTMDPPAADGDMSVRLVVPLTGTALVEPNGYWYGDPGDPVRIIELNLGNVSWSAINFDLENELAEVEAMPGEWVCEPDLDEEGNQKIDPDTGELLWISRPATESEKLAFLQYAKDLLTNNTMDELYDMSGSPRLKLVYLTQEEVDAVQPPAPEPEEPYVILTVPLTGTVLVHSDGSLSGDPNDPIRIDINLGNVSWTMVSLDLENEVMVIKVKPSESATEEEKAALLQHAQDVISGMSSSLKWVVVDD